MPNGLVYPNYSLDFVEAIIWFTFKNKHLLIGLSNIICSMLFKVIQTLNVNLKLFRETYSMLFKNFNVECYSDALWCTLADL